MVFWVPIAITAIITWGVVEVVKTSMRHAERIEKIKRGYPIDGAKPDGYVEKEDEFSRGYDTRQMPN